MCLECSIILVLLQSLGKTGLPSVVFCKREVKLERDATMIAFPLVM